MSEWTCKYISSVLTDYQSLGDLICDFARYNLLFYPLQMIGGLEIENLSGSSQFLSLSMSTKHNSTGYSLYQPRSDSTSPLALDAVVDLNRQHIVKTSPTEYIRELEGNIQQVYKNATEVVEHEIASLNLLVSRECTNWWFSDNATISHPQIQMLFDETDKIVDATSTKPPFTQLDHQREQGRVTKPYRTPHRRRSWEPGLHRRQNTEKHQVGSLFLVQWLFWVGKCEIRKTRYGYVRHAFFVLYNKKLLEKSTDYELYNVKPFYIYTIRCIKGLIVLYV